MSDMATWAARAAMVLLTTAGLSPAAAQVAAPPAGARYVAMGSSFAAGPLIATPADMPATRCTRSADNYPHQLARKRGYRLTDVSCSGATTANLLGPWNELPAQLDALTPDTALVTITIAGNDVGFSAALAAATCVQAGKADCHPPPAPTEKTWTDLEAALHRIAAETRRRAPAARLIFVEYPVILPERGVCASTPIAAADADAIRAIGVRLAALTAAVAQAEKAEVVDIASLSKGHDACAPERWAEGAALGAGPPTFAAYHPNLAGHMAVAAAIDRMLGK